MAKVERAARRYARRAFRVSPAIYAKEYDSITIRNLIRSYDRDITFMTTKVKHLRAALLLRNASERQRYHGETVKVSSIANPPRGHRG